MIDFQTVTKEFRSLIARRQELITLLGSVFAAAGVLLENTLQGGLPQSLASIEKHIFLFYALIIMVPSLILALRMAKLHAGMTLNGMLYAKLMTDQTFTRKQDVERASRHNFVGVSYLQFLLADFLGAFSTAILALTLNAGLILAVGIGVVGFFLWNGIYLRFHNSAVAIAREKIKNDVCEGFGPQDWLDHVSASLEDANHGLIGNVSFVGLMIFSVFEVMSGLGKIETNQPVDLPSEQILIYAPIAYSILMLVSCLVGLVINLRLRVAVGNFSLDLDPSDEPFRPFRLTDSYLGYLLLCFFTGIAFHLILTEGFPEWPDATRLAIDAFVFAVALSFEPITLIVMGRRPRRKETPRTLLLIDDAPKSGETPAPH